MQFAIVIPRRPPLASRDLGAPCECLAFLRGKKSHVRRASLDRQTARLSRGGTMNTKKLALLVLLSSSLLVPAAQAQIRHLEMRVEGMT